MPKVSVIIPVYNAEQYLPRCLNSVINQTLEDIEIICVNDCSTDKSLVILQEYASKDKRIKLINLGVNNGAAYARNLGIDEANSEYIGFVDSDDFIDLDFYEKLYKKSLEGRFDSIKGNIKLYDNETKSLTQDGDLDINYMVKKNKAFFCCTFTTAIYRLEFIKSYNIHFLDDFIYFEDPYFTITAAIFYAAIAVIDDVYYYYCNNKSSATRNPTEKHVICQVEGVKRIIRLLDENNVSKEHYKIVVVYLIRQLIYWCSKIDCQDKIIKIATDGLSYLVKNCKYIEEVLFLYYTLQKKIKLKSICYNLRKNIKNK